MSYLFYEWLHFAALFAVVISLAAHSALAWGQVTDSKKLRPFKIAHGVSLVILLVAGFGMLGKMGGGIPVWIYPKLLIWLALGLLPLLVRMRPQFSKFVLIVLWILLALASYFAVLKG